MCRAPEEVHGKQQAVGLLGSGQWLGAHPALGPMLWDGDARLPAPSCSRVLDRTRRSVDLRPALTEKPWGLGTSAVAEQLRDGLMTGYKWLHGEVISGRRYKQSEIQWLATEARLIQSGRLTFLAGSARNPRAAFYKRASCQPVASSNPGSPAGRAGTSASSHSQGACWKAEPVQGWQDPVALVPGSAVQKAAWTPLDRHQGLVTSAWTPASNWATPPPASLRSQLCSPCSCPRPSQCCVPQRLSQCFVLRSPPEAGSQGCANRDVAQLGGHRM